MEFNASEEVTMGSLNADIAFARPIPLLTNPIAPSPADPALNIPEAAPLAADPDAFAAFVILFVILDAPPPRSDDAFPKTFAALEDNPGI
jgi:hypothetical protein